MDEPSPGLAAALRRLDTLVDWERRRRDAMEPGLAPIRDLLARLGDPQRRYRCVHVTGTKGKGSVCALIEAALTAAGIAAGRYSTPWLRKPNEQILLSGNPISDPLFAAAIDRVMDHVDEARGASAPAGDSTYFDVMTAAAYRVFAEAGVEWAIVEAGMGGRFDSTNAIDGDVAVLTSVDLEHVEALGRTREEIALNKAGIVKPGAVLVTGLSLDDSAGRVATDYASCVGAQVVSVAIDPDSKLEDRNAALAGAVLDRLGGFGVCARAIRPAGALGAWLLSDEVRSAARLPGRLERLFLPRSNAPPIQVVLDGAHVASSLEAVLRQLDGEGSAAGDCTAVVGLAADKDAEAFLAVLRDHGVKAVVTTAPTAARPRPAAELARIAEAIGLAVIRKDDPAAAFEAAVDAATAAKGWVLVTGSLHLTAALRR